MWHSLYLAQVHLTMGEGGQREGGSQGDEPVEGRQREGLLAASSFFAPSRHCSGGRGLWPLPRRLCSTSPRPLTTMPLPPAEPLSAAHAVNTHLSHSP